MPSIVWNRQPEEAYKNPYEYAAQEQFVREADKLLESLFVSYSRLNLTFPAADKSLRKAIWMLQIDSLDAIRDCLSSLTLRQHRMAGRLFRDVVETLDLAAYLHSNSTKAQKQLPKWFQDEIIEHRNYREYIATNLGQKAADQRRDFYRQLSKFTHRTYRALLKSYSLGASDLIVYNSQPADALPQTIAAFYAIAAGLIKEFCEEASARGILTQEEVARAVKESLEEQTIPRQFAQM